MFKWWYISSGWTEQQDYTLVDLQLLHHYEAASEIALSFNVVKTCRNFHSGQGKSLFYHIQSGCRTVLYPQIQTPALSFLTWIRSDKEFTAEHRENAFQSRLFTCRVTQKEQKIQRGQMEQILHAIHNRWGIELHCSTFTVLLLTFLRQRQRNAHLERLKQSHRIWPIIHIKYEADATLRWGERCIMAELELQRHRLPPDYINPHLTAWHIFCWQSTSISCQTASFPQIYQLNWINYI